MNYRKLKRVQSWRGRYCGVKTDLIVFVWSVCAAKGAHRGAEASAASGPQASQLELTLHRRVHHQVQRCMAHFQHVDAKLISCCL